MMPYTNYMLAVAVNVEELSGRSCLPYEWRYAGLLKIPMLNCECALAAIMLPSAHHLQFSNEPTIICALLHCFMLNCDCA
jgi:hypothetical protein